MPLRRAGAEFFGTFVLVLGGVGAAVIAGDKIGNLGVAFAFGLSLLAMAYAIGPISGCHINPAVTVGLLVSRKIEISEAVRYWIAQVLGAIVAAGVLLIIANSRKGGYDAGVMGLGANGYGNHSPGGYSLGGAFLAETILTAFLIFTVLSATDKLANVAFAGIPIGLVLTLIHLVGIPITNLSVNPARSIGPAIFVGGWALSQLWLFIVAPVVGAVIGAGIHMALFKDASAVSAEESAVASDAPRFKQMA
ncbi:aquaporin Z [Solirubrobacter ginsenosidimutans]|uniref:Aquaporin Z n=1 Tax=Solirubrobacter ginsenosidimutans TaxID=490573 RepID=A0A9X3MTZ2_9ACTN|nr:aquaporin Z [Solirubrobacter ginsenosidimutans]MDA0162996.1 aquaporin Z [Solirubrobacter ginsenosidimutans]